MIEEVLNEKVWKVLQCQLFQSVVNAIKLLLFWSSIACKYYTRRVLSDGDKHPSLLFKTFCNTVKKVDEDEGGQTL